MTESPQCGYWMTGLFKSSTGEVEENAVGLTDKLLAFDNIFVKISVHRLVWFLQHDIL